MWSSLKPSRTPLKRSPLRRTSRKQAERNRQWKHASSGDGRCAIQIPGVCTGAAQGGHHILKRRFRNNTAGNRLEACNACNLYIEDHPAEAEARGLVIRGNGLPIAKFAALAEGGPHVAA